MLDAIPSEMLDALPEGMREEFERRREEQAQRLAALTANLVDKRKKAMDWRSAIGIEQEWMECEDAYEGIDDANRATEQPVSARLAKPRTHEGGAIGPNRKSGTRSTVFLNITRPYTDAAAARVADMLLPNDDRNWGIQPTPLPGFSAMGKDESPMPQDVAAAFGVRGAETVAQAVKMHLEQMKERAERAQSRIEDWLVECQYHAEVRKVIEDCAKYGTGILKGPVPTRRKHTSASAQDGAITLKVEESISPASIRVSPWDLFPSPSCGENVNNGDGVFERDRLSAKQLQDLIGVPGYSESEIKQALEEGPSKQNVSTDGRRTQDDDRFEVWYYTGTLSGADFKIAHKATSGGVDCECGDRVDAVCVLVNDRLIKASQSHLEVGDLPYDLMPWQRRVGMPFGIGVPKQISTAQRMLNAATRNMADNAALSSGPQIVLKKGVVAPSDGVFEITPRKFWFQDADTNDSDVDKAFRTFDIPTRQAELMSIIQFALKIAEDTTGLPMLMQGNQGAAPDTVGGMAMLNNNANTVLRRIARLFDDCITEPHIRRYYEWLMLYGDDDEKGDYTIDARGSTALVDRDIQQHAIMAMGPMVLDPRYGADPEMWFSEALKANKIDPKRIMLTEEKKAAQQQQMAQQQEMMARMSQMEQQLKAAIEQAKIQKDLTVAREDNALQRDIAAAELATRAAQQPMNLPGGAPA